MSADGEEGVTPRPVPGSVPGASPATDVTDEERNRFGVLLDHAAERGLLTPTEYRLRVGLLADATSRDELQRIVTELPAFGSLGSTGTGRTRSRDGDGAGNGTGGGPSELDAALWAGLTPVTTRRSVGSPWLILAVVVVALIAAMVVLGLVVDHVGHTHGTGLPGPGVRVVSRFRL